MQQHGSKYFAHRPPIPTWGVGQKGQNSFCSEYGHVAYQIKGNGACSNMVANILHADPPRPWGWGQNSTFSEHGHGAYQMKWNHVCSNTVAYIFARRPRRPWWVGSGVIIQLFHNMVMLHIKLNGITYAATWLQLFYIKTSSPLHTHTHPVLRWGQNSTFSENSHVAHQIKWNH